jgi:hypothetical protein
MLTPYMRKDVLDHRSGHYVYNLRRRAGLPGKSIWLSKNSNICFGLVPKNLSAGVVPSLLFMK